LGFMHAAAEHRPRHIDHLRDGPPIRKSFLTAFSRDTVLTPDAPRVSRERLFFRQLQRAAVVASAS
jgi:hypothetical protein